MITVRFPNGEVLQYNDTNHIVRGTEYTDLWDSSKKKQFIAQVPNTCIIEYVQPCQIYQTLDVHKIARDIEGLTKEVRLLKKAMKRRGE